MLTALPHGLARSRRRQLGWSSWEDFHLVPGGSTPACPVSAGLAHA